MDTRKDLHIGNRILLSLTGRKSDAVTKERADKSACLAKQSIENSPEWMALIDRVAAARLVV